MEEGLKNAAMDAGFEITVNRVGGMLSPFMTRSPVTNFSEVLTSDTILYQKFFNGMLEEGILLPPSQFEGWFLSAAHSMEDVARTITAAAKTFQNIKDGA